MLFFFMHIGIILFVIGGKVAAKLLTFRQKKTRICGCFFRFYFIAKAFADDFCLDAEALASHHPESL